MTTTISLAVTPALTSRGIVAVVIGNWLEFYDFLVFTFFAVIVGRDPRSGPGRAQAGIRVGVTADLFPV
jgi:hypothetical protein